MLMYHPGRIDARLVQVHVEVRIQHVKPVSHFAGWCVLFPGGFECVPLFPTKIMIGNLSAGCQLQNLPDRKATTW